MRLEIFCPECGSRNEEDFWIPYIDIHVPGVAGVAEELDYGRCNKCDVILVLRKLR